ncbi:DNA-directed DNA polymerase alpha catalytic subunit pol1 [Dispira parvispora]|uniref:DNA polymerase n=1 Tax=Dispira parvispora TaxID=1520584 RepID=A0A9W8B051_9FUNG|nr:DNA-directed DNA polymerase alpha catalytic subunit pol1 [Dispira parvispora]
MSNTPNTFGRSRREHRGKQAAQTTFEKLRAHRETGTSRLDTFEEEDDSLYLDPQETLYESAAQRRLEDDFVVDDEGFGYAENGNGSGDDIPYGSGDECGGGDRKGAKHDKTSGKRGKGKMTSGAYQNKVGQRKSDATPHMGGEGKALHQWIKRGGGGVAGSGSGNTRRVQENTKQEQDLLEDVLGDLNEEVDILPQDPPRPRTRLPAANRHSGQDARRPPGLGVTAMRRPSEKGLFAAKFTDSPVQSHSRYNHGTEVMDVEPTCTTTAPDAIKSSPRSGQSPSIAETVYQQDIETTTPTVYSPQNTFHPEDDMDDDPELLDQMVAMTHTVSEGNNQPHPITTHNIATPSVPNPQRTLQDLNDDNPVPLQQDFSLPQFGLNLTSGMDSTPTGHPDDVTRATSAVNTVAPEGILRDDQSLIMYWTDAFEKDGLVYLFGRAKASHGERYPSVCVKVTNLERNLYFLPREFKLDDKDQPTDQEVAILDVYQELQAMFAASRISRWRSKAVTRKYAFELPNVPAETTYLKVPYPYREPPFKGPLEGRTYSHVFGAHTSALETLITKRRMMGPCWLKIQGVTLHAPQVSWCQLEAVVSDTKHVTPMEDSDPLKPNCPPPLTVMTINLKTLVSAKKTSKEIIVANLLINRQVNCDTSVDIRELPSEQRTVVRALPGGVLPPGLGPALDKQKVAVTRVHSENELLNFIISALKGVDPDIVVSHNFFGHDLSLLLARMKHCKTGQWSALGRLRRTLWPKPSPRFDSSSANDERAVMSGRVVCDTYLTSKDLVRSKSYSLTNLAQSELHLERMEIDFEKIPAYYANAKDLTTLIRHCQYDAYLVASLLYRLQMLPLTKQLTNLAGNLWARTMMGARADRNEYLLLHEFRLGKYICPDKTFANAKPGPSRGAIKTKTHPNNHHEDGDVGMAVDSLGAEEVTGAGVEENTGISGSGTSGRRKPAYAGGLVLEPKRGFYDRFVLLLDFNSLYPSIIQEFNICFTTVNRHQQASEDELPELPDPDQEPGVLPRLLKTLVDRRRQVKQLMKAKGLSELEKAQYNIRQQALKLTANSMYGCLGYAKSRFYAKPLAMLITHKGREILQSTVQVAEAEQLDVIYGDTDSIMIHTNSCDLDQVLQIGREFKKKINERYRLLELDIDGIFQRMLLLRKKKYAALIIKDIDSNPSRSQGAGTTPRWRTEVETKGLDVVRRDWCELSHDVSNFVLTQILSGEDRDEITAHIHSHLTETGEAVRAGRVPLEKYVINKGLNKNPRDYNDAKSQPHVQVALRMLRQGQSVGSGDTVPFVIVTPQSHQAYVAAQSTPNGGGAEPQHSSGTGSGSYAEQAYHPREVENSNGLLQVDGEWYLKQQVHAPIARLCEPIEGTDSGRIAGFLGLDPGKFRSYLASSNDNVAGFSGPRTVGSRMSDEERFADVDRWQVRCNHCQQMFEFPGVVHLLDLGSTASGKAITGSTSRAVIAGFQCPVQHCRKMVSPPSLQVQLACAIRRHLQRYHNYYLVCDDAMDAGQHRTRKMSVYGKRCLHEHCRGRMSAEYSDYALYTQLQYYAGLFQKQKTLAKIQDKREQEMMELVYVKHENVFRMLQGVVASYLDQSARQFVNLETLFKDLVQIRP